MPAVADVAEVDARCATLATATFTTEATRDDLVEGLSELMDCEIPVQGLLDDARNIEERVREAFERAQAMALPAPDSEDDDDDVPMVF